MIHLQTSTGTGTATSTSAHSVATKNGRRKCAPISDACAAGLTSVQQPEVSDASTDPTTAMTGIAVGHTHAHARSLSSGSIPACVISNDTRTHRQKTSTTPLHGSTFLWAYYNCDSSTTRYNTLRGFSCASIRDRIRDSVVGVSCMLTDSSMHTAFTVYLYRPTLHRVCEYARNCVYKRN